jgi:hypothetical protein
VEPRWDVVLHLLPIFGSHGWEPLLQPLGKGRGLPPHLPLAYIELLGYALREPRMHGATASTGHSRVGCTP